MSELDTEPDEARPLRATVRYWPMALPLASLGLVAGIAVGVNKPPVYTAETRLAIGAQGLSSYAIPGFALAAQELAADYARYVSLAQDGSALKLALGTRASEIVGLSASPVPNSSVVSIEAESKDGQLATQASNAVGAALIAATNVATSSQNAAALLKQYNAAATSAAQANQALITAQALVTKLTTPAATAPATPGAKAATPSPASTAALAAAQAAEVAAATKYASLLLQQTTLGNQYQTASTTTTPSSNLNVVEPGVIVMNNRTKNEELYGLVGLAGGAGLALIAATIRARLARRRRNPAKPKEKKEKKEKRKKGQGENADGQDASTLQLSDSPSAEEPSQGSSVALTKNTTTDRPKEKNWPTRDTPPPSSRSPYPRPASPKDLTSLTPSAGRGNRNSETRDG